MKPEFPHCPEWIDAKLAKHLFSLGRTTLYALATNGRIKSVSLRERGKIRGKRLFSYYSIHSYLEGRADKLESKGQQVQPDTHAAPISMQHPHEN